MLVVGGSFFFGGGALAPKQTRCNIFLQLTVDFAVFLFEVKMSAFDSFQMGRGVSDG